MEHFCKIPAIGDTYIKTTYLFYDEPLLFLLYNDKNEKYIAVKENDNEYLISQVTDQLIQEAENKKISIRDLIQRSNNVMLYNQNRNTTTYVNAYLLPNSMLPEKNEFI